MLSRKKINTRKRSRKKGKYRSVFEGDFAASLSVPFEYESQKITYVVPRTYTPDFIFEKKNGTYMYVETKGVLDVRSRTTLLHAKKCNPELDIRIIFQRGSNTISKISATTYLEWARKNGFPCAEKRMPSEWKKELK